MSTTTLTSLLRVGERSRNKEGVAGCALPYERFILATRPSVFIYAATLTEIQERTFGNYYYQEFVKPDASYFIQSDPEIKEFVFGNNYRPEQIFTCKGVLAVNVYHAYKLGYPLDYQWYSISKAIYPASKIYQVWYNELGSVVKALVNYRYYRNLYEHTKTRIRLKRREEDLEKVFYKWKERYFRLNFQDKFPPNPSDPTLIIDSVL